MKTIIKHLQQLVAGIFILLTTGCNKNFLDRQPDDMLDLDAVFAQALETERYLANVYSFVPPLGDGNQGFEGSFMSIADEADFGASFMYANHLHNIGNWGPSTTVFDFWTYLYQGVRSASVFIERVDECQEMSAELRKQRKAEARALRAFYYSLLLRQYGPVVVLAETPFEIDTPPESLQLARTPYDACVQYISAEFDQAISDLPARITDQGQLGRVDQLVVLAAKARMLLYAASPLFNGNADYGNFVNPDGTPLINTVYDHEKWKTAADAAKAVIDRMPSGLLIKTDETGSPNPLSSYRDVFLDRWNQEIIWGRQPKGELLDWHWWQHCAPHQAGGEAVYGATQQQVDAFFMANGERPITGYNTDGSPIINPRSGYTEQGFAEETTQYWNEGVSKMYVGREPRFYATISFNGASWVNRGEDGNQSYRFEFWAGGADLVGDNYSKTGYAIRKFIHPSTVWNPNWANVTVEKLQDIIFRLGEVYLNYAEALNEYDFAGNQVEILHYLNLIRKRAGIPAYGTAPGQIAPPPSQSAMRDAIRAERRAELVFEDLRIWDCRRWKIAEQTDDGPFYGINIKGGSHLSDPLLYKRVVFENRVFQRKHYLWPIPQSEVERNRQCVQNPFW